MADPANVRLLDVLTAMARDVAADLEADACAVSRAIGEVLVLVAERAPEGRSLLMGQGYLVTDFPLTHEVLESGRPRALTLEDDGVDDAEARLLRELGFASLLMLPLSIDESTWGLVEVYRIEPRPFDSEAVRAAEAILARTSARASSV